MGERRRLVSGVRPVETSVPEVPKPLAGTGAADPGFEALLHRPGIPADMDIERETVVEASVSFVAVLVFIGAVVAVGSTYRTNGHLSRTGGLAIVGAVVLFILVMTGVGLWFANQQG
jgi:hypothetical protein